MSNPVKPVIYWPDGIFFYETQAAQMIILLAGGRGKTKKSAVIYTAEAERYND